MPGQRALEILYRPGNSAIRHPMKAARQSPGGFCK
jgi:hypothetical protein